MTLDEQDRGGWHRGLVDEGHALVRECLARAAAGESRPGTYQLLALTPTPVVALNRAVALAEVDGPEVALAEVDRLPLEGYHAWHATRADLLRRLGRSRESSTAYDAAIGATDNPAEVAYLTRRRDQLARDQDL